VANRWSRPLRVIIPLLLGILLIIYAYSRFTEDQIDQIRSQIGNVDYAWISLGLVFMLASHLSRAWRWRYMLEAVGSRTDFISCVAAIGSGYAMNMLIPRSGEVARAVIARDQLGAGVDKALGTIVAERVLDMVILLAITFTTFLLANEQLINLLSDALNSAFAKANTPRFILLTIVSVVVLIAGTVLIYRLNPLKKFKKFIEGLKEGLLTVFTMRQKWAYLGHTLLIWTLYILMFYVSFFALPATAEVSFAGVLAGFVAGSFAVAFTNGGFGAYPFFIAQVLTLFAVPETTGTAFGLVVWLSQTVLVFIYGIVSFAIISLNNRGGAD